MKIKYRKSVISNIAYETLLFITLNLHSRGKKRLIKKSNIILILNNFKKMDTKLNIV